MLLLIFFVLVDAPRRAVVFSYQIFSTLQVCCCCCCRCCSLWDDPLHDGCVPTSSWNETIIIRKEFNSGHLRAVTSTSVIKRLKRKQVILSGNLNYEWLNPGFIWILNNRHVCYFHMGICDRYSDWNKNYRRLYKLNEGIDTVLCPIKVNSKC